LAEERKVMSEIQSNHNVDWTAKMFMLWVKDISTVKLQLLAPKGQKFAGSLDFPDV
jgi:hypothetical protein